MIHGIGTDIVQISRIQRLLEENGHAFLAKIFTPLEVELLQSRFQHELTQAVGYVAKRFAAKEACAKALGCGIGADLRFHDMEITSDALAKPALTVRGVAFDSLRSAYHNRTRFPIHLSLSDEKEYAQAFVVIEIREFNHA